jgi:hypothetical protein
VFGLVLASPVGFDANAAKKKARASACVSTGMDGKQTKWRCKAGQKCCFDWLANKGNCVGANDICL